MNMTAFTIVTIFFLLLELILFGVIIYFSYKYGIKQRRFCASPLLLFFYGISLLNLIIYMTGSAFMLHGFQYAYNQTQNMDLKN